MAFLIDKKLTLTVPPAGPGHYEERILSAVKKLIRYDNILWVEHTCVKKTHHQVTYQIHKACTWRDK